MLSQLLAISSAATRAMDAVSAKKGLVKSNPLSGLLLSTLILTVGLWILAAPVFIETRLSSLAIMAFTADGLAGTAIARLLTFVAIERVGAGITMSIIGTQSLFAALFAMVMLQEGLTALLAVGTVLIVLGVVLLCGNTGDQKWKKRDLLIPLAASVFYGLISIFKKVGLNEVGSPIVGAAISSVTGFLAILAYISFCGKRNEINLTRNSTKFFILAGVFTIITLAINFSAILLGSVVVVMSLFNTAPLFTLLISHFFLRDVERITPRIVAGAILIVAGAVLVIF